MFIFFPNYLYLWYKCDRCAYVPTTDFIVVKITEQEYNRATRNFNNVAGEYTKIGNVTLDGEIHDNNYRLIGHDFWQIPKISPKQELICTNCWEELKIVKYTPFIRREGQYRLDIIAKCDFCGKEHAFGVHITKHEYEIFKRV